MYNYLCLKLLQKRVTNVEKTTEVYVHSVKIDNYSVFKSKGGDMLMQSNKARRLMNQLQSINVFNLGAAF